MPSVRWVVSFLAMYERAAAHWEREVYRNLTFAGAMIASSGIYALGFAHLNEITFRALLAVAAVLSLAMAVWAIRWAMVCRRLGAAVRLQVEQMRAQIRAESAVDIPLTMVFPDE